MCGIAATVRYGKRGPVDRDQLRAMRDGMRARGPDDEGLWVSPDERVGLAHRRLSIIDLSPHGAQPMATCDDRGPPTAVVNTVNRKDLRREGQVQPPTTRCQKHIMSHEDT